MISHPNAVVQVHSQLSFNSHNPSFGKICRDENRVVRRQFPELRLLPSFRPFALHSPIPTDRTGQEGIPPFPPFLLPPPASRAPSFPRVFSSILRRSSVRSQMKYNPLADGRTDTGGRRRAPSPAPDCLKSEALYLCWRGEQRRRGYCNDDRSVRPRDPGLF